MGCGGSKPATQPSVSAGVENVDQAKSEERKDAPKTLMDPAVPATSEQKTDMSKKKAKQPVDMTQLLNQEFDRIDVNKDGSISKEELAASLEDVLDCSGKRKWLDIERQEQKTFRQLVAESGLNPYLNSFEQFDTDKDGKISREEFFAQMHPARAAVTIEGLLFQVFQRVDVNRDGAISREELSNQFKLLLTTSERQSRKNFGTLMKDAGMLSSGELVFDDIDANHDGKITWDEFRSKLTAPVSNTVAWLKQIFSQLDANGDGNISKEELSSNLEVVLDCSDYTTKKTLRTLCKEAGFETDFYLFEKLDTNKDGKITWAEFEASLQASKDTLQLVTEQGAEEQIIEPPAYQVELAQQKSSAWCCGY